MGKIELDNGVVISFEENGKRSYRVELTRKDGTGLSDTLTSTELKRVIANEVRPLINTFRGKKLQRKLVRNNGHVEYADESEDIEE